MTRTFQTQTILTKLLANSVVVDWTIFLTLDKDLSITAEEQRGPIHLLCTWNNRV